MGQSNGRAHDCNEVQDVERKRKGETMELFRQPRSVKPSQFHILVVLALLASSPSAPALGGAAPSWNKTPSVRALLNSPTKPSPKPNKPGSRAIGCPRLLSGVARRGRAEGRKMISAVVGLRKADAALSGFLKTHPDDLAFLWTQVHLDFLKRHSNLRSRKGSTKTRLSS